MTATIKPALPAAYGKLIGPRFLRTVRGRGNRPHLRACRETRLVMIGRIIEPGLSPELTGDLDGVDAGRLPPGLLVASVMDRAVM